MATGSYLSSTAQKQIFDKELREAEQLAEREPYLAAEGLLDALSREGLKKEQSYRLVKLLSEERGVFLRTFQEKVFGLGTAEINRPLQAALVMGLSFVVGAGIPLLPYLLLAGMNALYVSIALAAATLFSVGVFKGRLAGRPLLASGVEFFFIAVGAALVGYLIGLVVQYFFPGIALPVG
jgi:predicted membrane protein (TIGR00267 family)